jgi:hypothetical protein
VRALKAIERLQGIAIGCREEAALVRRFITLRQFEGLLAGVAAEARRSGDRT